MILMDGFQQCREVVILLGVNQLQAFGRIDFYEAFEQHPVQARCFHLERQGETLQLAGLGLAVFINVSVVMYERSTATVAVCNMGRYQI